MNRVILIDWSVFMFRAIFASYKNKNGPPATYSTLTMILSCLRELDVSIDDKIIVAIDSKKGSWRKEIDSDYKANRKAKRQEFDIDWDYYFKQYDKLKYNLSINTPFLFIEADKMEADDIIAYSVKYFAPSECVIISTDSDYEQLACYNNVKIFSPKTKTYKIVKNPHLLLAKKIQKETTDNLISPIITKADFDRRKMIVDLQTLPDFVEEKVKKELDRIPNDAIMFNYEKLMYPSLNKRIIDIFNKKKNESGQLELI